MITASELAGYFAAHAVWSLSDGESFHPIFAYTTEDDARHMQRVVTPTAEEAVAFGRKQLESNEKDANDAVLIYDGRITGAAGARDALIIELRCYAFPWARATYGVPYTPKASGRFAVFRPVVLRWDDCADFDLDWSMERFFVGVHAHANGGAVWNAHRADE